MNQLSGYVEVTLGEFLLPFKFGSNAYGLFCAMQQPPIEFWELSSCGIFGKMNEEGEMTTPPDYTKLRDLFFCAHQAAMRSKGEKEMVNLYLFGDLLDETEGAIEKLQEAVVQAKMMGMTLVDLAKGKEIKKK